MLDQHFDYEQLLAFAADELSADSALSIAAHIATCPQCSQVVRHYKLISRALRTDDSREPPLDTIARAYAIFTQHRPAHPSFRRLFELLKLLLSVSQLSRATILLVVLLANLVMCGGLGAVTVSAQSSIPGDSLYSLKLNLESIQLAATWDTGDRALRHLAFADSRANETVALTAFQRSREIPGTLAAFEKEVNLGVQTFALLVKQNYNRAQVLGPVIENGLARQTAMLTNLHAFAIDAVKPALEHAIAVGDAQRAAVNALSGQLPAPMLTSTPLATRLLEPTTTRVPALTESWTPVSAQPSLTVVPVSTTTPEPTLTSSQPTRTQTPLGLIETPTITATLPLPTSTPRQVKTPPGLEKVPPGQEKVPPGQEKVPPGQEKDQSEKRK